MLEEMVDQLLLPCLPGRSVEAAQAHDNEVEVQHGHLRPGTEGGRETEICKKASLVSKRA